MSPADYAADEGATITARDLGEAVRRCSTLALCDRHGLAPRHGYPSEPTSRTHLHHLDALMRLERL